MSCLVYGKSRKHPPALHRLSSFSADNLVDCSTWQKRRGNTNSPPRACHRNEAADRPCGAISPGTYGQSPAGPATALQQSSSASGVPDRRPSDGSGPHGRLQIPGHLLGRKFTLLTDHAPLQWMARAKDTNARVTRWFLALQDFCFVVRHRAGASNANADGLSRIWSAFAGLSGVTPHPPPVSPLLLPYVSTGTRTTLRGGGSVTSVPSTHQRCPGDGHESPAPAHHGWIGHTWGSFAHGQISRVRPGNEEKRISCKPEN